MNRSGSPTAAEPQAGIELFLSEEVQKILDHLAELLELRVTFYSRNGMVLLRGSRMSNSGFCDFLQNQLGALPACLARDREEIDRVLRSGQISDYCCHAGLHEAIAPLFIHGWIAGFLMIGQFRTGRSLPECARQLCRTPEEKAELQKHFLALPLISAQKWKSTLALLELLVNYIADRELAVLQNNDFYTKIEDYIRRHALDGPRLPEMARKLGKSVSAISQFLRRERNTSFKRMQLEYQLKLAEQFWRENPGSTVREAAFAAGFNDPLYFSKVFRKYRGEPPLQFRNHLNIKAKEYTK